MESSTRTALSVKKGKEKQKGTKGIKITGNR
jgi:hypothetical protein